MRSGQESPPAFARMAADPLRWRLLRELAVSDRRVRELVALTGQPQNLVSYHLGRLRAGGMVGSRRSSFDGRDTYYRLDLARCAQLLAEAGAALHPGLAPGPMPAIEPATQPAAQPATQTATQTATQSATVPTSKPPATSAKPATVLFLCTGNSARSQAAEALSRVRSGGRVESFSAGSRPRPAVHPEAVQVLAARGIDLSDRRPKDLRDFARRRFRYVITLCDRVREVCPAFPGDPTYIHWSIPDPSAAGEPGSAAFESMAAEIETRVGFWLASIDAAPVAAGS